MEKTRQDALEMGKEAHAAQNENAKTPEDEGNLVLFRIFFAKPIAAIL